MTALLILIGLIGFSTLLAMYAVNAPPAQIANALRVAGPLALGILGGIFSMFGRVSIGGPLIMLAFALWARGRSRKSVHTSAGQKSTVRSAMLEMMLDHDTGAMNGVVLAGDHEGAVLDEMDEASLMALATEVASDAESAQLLEAYLDRRMPNWREDHETDAGTRSTGTAESGAMTEQEAYQILGLEAGATAAEIRKAHRSLIQRVHPDVGGNAFLAQRINEAKDFLLRTHKNGS